MKKIFLFFNKSKDVFAQTEDLLEAEIPKCRLRHDMNDFIVHSDVSEFQSEKIKQLMRFIVARSRRDWHTHLNNGALWSVVGGR